MTSSRSRMTMQIRSESMRAKALTGIIRTLIALCVLQFPVHVSAAAPAPSIDEVRAKADAGDAEAMYQMGHRLELGEGIVQNDREAAKWYQKAADAGNGKAMLFLGRLYLDGRGL